MAFLFALTFFSAVLSESVFSDIDEYFEAEEFTELEPYEFEESDFEVDPFDLDFETMEAIEWCSICQEVADFARKMVNNHAAPALRNVLINKLCVKYKGIKNDICVSASNKIVDMALELVQKYATSDKICRKVKLC
ncbi:uncharacterized protein MONOS_4673 [Monocercomonoides exilis]|uniref:uncharacterized protein n=1 Tax=Monocercomonoides exilis TaxID=2049356 RepID=UPI0035594017|nr:hypothetical protein MONOS_4673 [Monocercomonoides exilis]|eukprot:MONOS_4673.1-p1 / transcript=MONOS_4673.1 / gene=MONOS_4673 / organism=Monocercomonoides_exilis_PA203 / gene_product=unspecified product / transcript_product=unspecified product / location=Mono_scaffold00126:96265-96672(-) / protein_length=136 / sequence_SO=supercontig / SO=protein_coding / is_pseudo=false